MGSAAGFRSHTNLAANITSEENVLSLNNYAQLEPSGADQQLYCRCVKEDLTPTLDILESEVSRGI